eukprot:g62312.t1
MDPPFLAEDTFKTDLPEPWGLTGRNIIDTWPAILSSDVTVRLAHFGFSAFRAASVHASISVCTQDSGTGFLYLKIIYFHCFFMFKSTSLNHNVGISLFLSSALLLHLILQ